MNLPYRACLTSRSTSTRRVLAILSRVTTPIRVRRLLRSVAAGGVGSGMGRALGFLWLLGQLPLPLHGPNASAVAPGLADLARRLQPVRGRLEPELEQVLLDVAEGERQLLVAHPPVLGGLRGLLCHGNNSCQTACRFTNRHLNGILYATRARQSLAAGSGRPPISNNIMPGFTTAAQYSGSPLPLPIRVSAGMEVTDLCGKTRMYSRPSPRMNWATVTRPASRASADSQPPSSDCRPNSPKATVLPRVALPRTRPRCVFRYFTRLGICGMGRPPPREFQVSSSKFQVEDQHGT